LSLAKTATVPVEFAIPYVNISDIIITENNFTAAANVIDIDNVISSSTVPLIITGPGGPFNTQININTPTAINVPGLQSNQAYTAKTDTTLNLLDGPQLRTILDLSFNTAVSTANLPAFTNFDVTNNLSTLEFDYQYNFSDPVTLTMENNLIYKNANTDAVVFTQPLSKQVGAISDATSYLSSIFFKNLNYAIAPETYYANKNMVSIAGNVPLKLTNQNGLSMTYRNNEMIATAETSNESQVRFVPIAGFAGEYRIIVGLAPTTAYITYNGTNLIPGQLSNASSFTLVNNGGKYYLQEKASKQYITVTANLFRLTNDTSLASLFTPYEVKKIDTTPVDVFVQPAELPIYEERLAEATSSVINLQFVINDPYNLITANTLTVTLFEGNTQINSEIVQPNVVVNFRETGLEQFTEYRVEIAATININEVGSANTRYVIHDELIRTRPETPFFTTTTAA